MKRLVLVFLLLLPACSDGQASVLEFDDGELDLGDMEDCGYERSSSLNYDPTDLEGSDNSPFTLEYSPAPSTLPLFSASY
tara:strand:- start:188 stop:427 length:240 start_codon:yes stop_codon:yes gene_type:complete